MLQRSLHIEQRLTPGQCVLQLEGPLVMSTMSQLFDLVRADNARSLIVDLTAVPFVDSAGIGALVAAYVSSQNSGRNLALVGTNDRVRNSLRLAWVEQLFRFFDSVTAAEQSSTTRQPPS
jgi:anti-sigma B factor antagonist